ncbi:MAG: glycosyltransferase family 39 protein, partial [Deltaproteobacteria bacterium]|nr:glycosyltransferase family 39 protein [Deltaproteobacteria bacterium]
MSRATPAAQARVQPARWRAELLAIGCALLGVLARCTPWRSVFGGDGVLFFDVDPYYHLRRARLIVEQFPALPQFDPWIGFPWGASIPWPPGLDLLLALPALLGASWQAVEVWAALLPPLLGGGAVYLVYRLGRQLLDPAAGLVAALLFAILPGAAESALLGRADHHALVAPVVLAMYGTLLACLRAKTPRASRWWGIGCGALAALSVVGWTVTPPLYLAPLLVLLLALGGTSTRSAARRAAWYGLGSAALLVALAVLLVGDLERRPFDLYQPSLFTLLP